MSDLSLALLIWGAFVLSTGLWSIPLERFPVLSRPIIALALGVLAGPLVSGLLRPSAWTDEPAHLLQILAELTMSVSVLGIALRLPRAYLWQRRRDFAWMMLLVMPAMALLSGACLWLALDLPLGVALLAGAVITPTDPILSTTIVHGAMAEQYLPTRLRHVLSAESGANDGLAMPLVLLPALLLTEPVEAALGEWLVRVILRETVGAVILGGITGYVAGWATRASDERGWAQRPSMLSVTVALTLLVFGLTRGVGSNPVLAAFTAGVAFDNAVTWSRQETSDEVQDAIDQFFSAPIFIVFGLYLPVAEWWALGWAGLGVVVAVLLLRRLPVLLVVTRWLTSLRGWREAAFAGWFGPMGVAAIFYALLAEERTGHHEVWVIGSLVVAASVVVHGASAAPLTQRLGAHERAH